MKRYFLVFSFLIRPRPKVGVVRVANNEEEDLSTHIESYMKVELAIFLHVNDDKSGCLGFEGTIMRP